MKTNREKVIGLLDYVEQVVRLDERVAMRVQDYRLSDGSTFSIREDDTRGLPGIRHDIRLDDLPIWLEIERLSRQSPPTPDQQIAEWLVVSNDPARQPELLAERIVTVDAGGRDKAIEEGRVLTEDIFTAPRAKGEAHNAPKKFDLRLKLSNHPTVEHEAGQWISNVWRKWADEEIPRRRTIKLYQKLYKLLQQVESAGAESPVEVVWGVGNVSWEKSQHLIDRPLLECRVDIEIDDKKGGAIRIRPTGLDVSFDLKPYEEVGCQGLPMLADLIRRELSREKNDEGVSPFVRDSFEPILSAAANRIDPDGIYLPDLTDGDRKKVGLEKNLAISDQWVLFARPRSQHIVLQDIDRLRRAASKDDASVGTIAERLVTEPSEVASGEGWSPLASAIGVTQLETGSTNSPSPLGDVFFPKPFNDDQLEIVKKLSRSDGVVVQGPPGTGKTHTIANLICHAMATGQRVLVVSRGEPALAVLRDQLPKEVRPLAIAILSSERQGLMQIESAIREIQSVVDASNPEQRLKKISRLESEIVELRRQIEKAEAELESIAIAHLSKVGPRKETPAELARRIVTEREKYQWFVDRPQKFASETDLTDDALVSLQAAVTDVGNLIDHLGIELPSVLDLPTQNEVGRWHHELQQARALHETMMTASESPVRMGAVDLSTSEKLATTLENLVKCSETASSLPWLNPILEAAALGHEDQWLDLLRDRISEWERLEVDRIKFANYVAQFPRGIIENEEARAAVSRAARGERLWPLFTIGKSEARSLVGGIKINGKSIDGADVDIWKHVEERLEFHARNIDADVKWHGFLNAIRASAESFRDSRPSVAGCLRAVENAVAMKDALTKIAPGSPEIAQLIRDSEVARNLIVQIRAMIGATELGSTRDKIDRVLSKFAGKLDRTSGAIQQLFNDVVGRSEVTPEQVVSVWRSTLQRLQLLASLRPAMGTIERISGEIEREGAPTLARQILLAKKWTWLLQNCLHPKPKSEWVIESIWSFRMVARGFRLSCLMTTTTPITDLFQWSRRSVEQL